jgi:hypothetical protein
MVIKEKLTSIKIGEKELNANAVAEVLKTQKE